ncbi:hypothetical protein YC2023_079072 [Brassica napus]
MDVSFVTFFYSKKVTKLIIALKKISSLIRKIQGGGGNFFDPCDIEVQTLSTRITEIYPNKVVRVLESGGDMGDISNGIKVGQSSHDQWRSYT